MAIRAGWKPLSVLLDWQKRKRLFTSNAAGKEIIAPALARLRKGYEPDLPRTDYRAELRRLAES